MKKKIAASLVGETKEQRTHIFALAQHVVSGTSINVSIQLCARLALLRAEYVTSSGKDFYNKVDKRLANIRNTYPSSGNVTRFFRSVLNHDVESHGHNNLHIEILAPADTQTDETERVMEHTIEGSNEAGVPLTDAAQSGPSTSSNQSPLNVSSTMAGGNGGEGAADEEN